MRPATSDWVGQNSCNPSLSLPRGAALWPAPAFAPDDAQRRWRPLSRFRSRGQWTLGRIRPGLVDPGADDTVLPLDLAELLNVSFYAATTHFLRWRGQRHSLRYGDVTLELADDEGNVLAWPAVVAFTEAPCDILYSVSAAVSNSSTRHSVVLDGSSSWNRMRHSRDCLPHDPEPAVQLDAYEQLQRAVDYDTSDPDPRAF